MLIIQVVVFNLTKPGKQNIEIKKNLHHSGEHSKSSGESGFTPPSIKIDS